jgi:hypothetical protein
MLPIGYTAGGTMLLIGTDLLSEAEAEDLTGHIFYQFPYYEETWHLCESFDSLLNNYLRSRF